MIDSLSQELVQPVVQREVYPVLREPILRRIPARRVSFSAPTPAILYICSWIGSVARSAATAIMFLIVPARHVCYLAGCLENPEMG